MEIPKPNTPASNKDIGKAIWDESGALWVRNKSIMKLAQ
jgi:hypothetical protein